MGSDDSHGYLGRTVPVQERLDDFLPGRSLLIKELAVDEFATRVRYEIRPPISERPTPPEGRWLLAASDDLGNEYVSAGGAFGLSRLGTFTEGEHSLQPPPDPRARYLDLAFIGPSERGGEESLQHVMRVHLA